MTIKERLYPFQKDDLQFLIDHPKAINGNVMGLGKTIEAMALMEELNTRHNLIVCRKTMVNEWFHFIDTWLKQDCLTPHENSTYDHKLAGLDLEGPRFVCINYDLLAMTKYSDILREVDWDMIIFDEAHHLKNPDAARTKEAIRLTYGKSRLLFMTGTPIQNSPMDLYPLFRMMNPREYHNWRAWRNWFCVVEIEEIWMKPKGGGRPYPRIIKRIIPGQVENEEALNQLLHMYMVRHEKHEVLKDLPPKQYRTVPVSLGSEAEQYKQMERDYLAILDSGESITSPTAMSQMTRLRQICLEPNLLSENPTSTPSNKTLTLIDIIEDSDSKLVVYSFFEQYTRLLSYELTTRKVPHVIITGQVKGQDRLQAQLDFQNKPEIKVCLGTIGAMGEGLTLSAADIVVFTDVFWNPAVNEQAEDRVYGRLDKGLTQDKSALIIDLLCEGTVEEHVHKIIRAKQEMFEKVVYEQAIADSMRRSQ